MILQTWAINGHPTAIKSSLFDVSSELSIWGSQRAPEIRLTIFSWCFFLDVSKQRMFLSDLQTHVICLMPSFYSSRFMAKRIFMNFNYIKYIYIYVYTLLCVNFKCKYRFLLVCSDITSQFFSSQCISSFATFSEVSSYVREVPPVGWTRDPVASIRWEVAQHEAWGNLPVTPGDLHRKQPKKKRWIGWNEEYGYGGWKQNWRRVTKKDTKGLA